MLDRPTRNRQRRGAITLVPVLYLSWLIVILLWPKYVSLRVGPFGLNPAVYFSAFMFIISLCVLISRDNQHYSFLYSAKKHWYVWTSGMMFYVWIFICNIFSSFPVQSMLSSIKEFLLGGGLFLVGFTFPLRLEGISTLRSVFVSCAVLIALIGLVEVATSQPFLYSLGIDRFAANTEVVQYLAASSYRDGAFRPISLTAHSIVMGQFLAVSLLFVLPPIVRPISVWTICAPLLLAGILLSTARSPIIVLLVGITVLYVLLPLRNGKALLYSTVQLIFVFSIFSFIYYLMADTIIALLSGTTATETSSNMARENMIEAGIAALRSSPIFGYGSGMAAHIAGMSTQLNPTIDNYYLSTAVDYGYVGVLLFIMLISAFVVALTFSSLQASHRELQRFVVLVAAFVLALAVGQYVISISDNVSFIYFLTGLSLGLVSRARHTAKRVTSKTLASKELSSRILGQLNAKIAE